MRWSAHLSMLFTEHAPLDRPAAAARAGFRCVETWWPPAEDVAAWVTAVRAAELDVACVNADGGDIGAGERGFCTDPRQADRTIEAVRAAVVVAAAVDAPAVNVLAGLISPERPAADQRAAAVEVLRACGEIAAATGRVIVVEPINDVDVPGYLVPTPDAAIALLADIAHPGVRLLYDAYHVARGGGEPLGEVARAGEWIAHVQYADCPGRGAPGSGALNLSALVERLAAVGYDGAIGLEYAPGGPTELTLAALADVTLVPPVAT